MDLEELSKHQIVLLTLLVSFVTSIATGIVTVTLMDQAPPAVTRTINRVVERTVERVVPEESTASVIQRETVVVRDQGFSPVIEKATQNVVRIYAETDLTNEKDLAGDKAVFKGLGVVIDEKGTLLTDKSVVDSNKMLSAVLLLDGGKKEAVYPLEVLSLGDDYNYAFARFVTEEDEKLPALPRIQIAQIGKAKLGENIVALSGEARDIVTTGIITELVEKRQPISKEVGKEVSGETSTRNADTSYVQVKTNLDTGVLYPGAPLINADGNIIALFMKGAESYQFKTAGVLQKTPYAATTGN